jgi:hypothetical protein
MKWDDDSERKRIEPEVIKAMFIKFSKAIEIAIPENFSSGLVKNQNS